MTEIRRTGRRFPIRAVLSRNGKQTRLYLYVPVFFRDTRTEKTDPAGCRRRALAGFRKWSGTYDTGDGGTISIAVKAQAVRSPRHALRVYFTDGRLWGEAAKLLPPGKLQRRVEQAQNAAGFALVGANPDHWRFSHPRLILLRPDCLGPDLAHAAAHELGHALGVGDLYPDDVSGYPGPDSAVRQLLAPYAQGGRFHAVMDDCGPVTPIDALLAVEAIATGRFQNYQTRFGKGTVSTILHKEAVK